MIAFLPDARDVSTCDPFTCTILHQLRTLRFTNCASHSVDDEFSVLFIYLID